MRGLPSNCYYLFYCLFYYFVLLFYCFIVYLFIYLFIPSFLPSFLPFFLSFFFFLPSFFFFLVLFFLFSIFLVPSLFPCSFFFSDFFQLVSFACTYFPPHVLSADTPKTPHFSRAFDFGLKRGWRWTSGCLQRKVHGLYTRRND